MKLPSSFSKILSNKYFLYFILFLAGSNILGYIVKGKINAIIFFALVAFLTYNFSKNLVVVLGVAIVLTNMLMLGQTVKEGLENPTSAPPKAEEKKKEDGIMTEPDEAVKEDTADAKANPNMTDTPTETVTSSSSTTSPTESMNVMSRKRNRIDYASTVEDAYGDLSKILGGDGIKNLTQDTQKLMGQQLQLAEAMKSMTPLLESAKNMLDGFDMKSLSGISDFAKSFGADVPGIE